MILRNAFRNKTNCFYLFLPEVLLVELVEVDLLLEPVLLELELEPDERLTDERLLLDELLVERVAAGRLVVAGLLVDVAGRLTLDAGRDERLLLDTEDPALCRLPLVPTLRCPDVLRVVPTERLCEVLRGRIMV